MKQFFKKIIVALLTLEARVVLRKYHPNIVAVTGSVGKTSTKDAIFAVLKGSVHVRRSEKTFNTDVGLPLTVLGLPNAWGSPVRWLHNFVDGLFLIISNAPYPAWLVLEVGADRPGDIRWLASWIRAQVVVITRLPEVPTHVEFFASAEEVVEEKAALIDALVPGGTLVLYADDSRTRNLAHRLPAPDAKILTFGLSSDADVRGEDFALLREEGVEAWPVGMSGRIVVEGTSTPVELVGALGSHAFLPLIAAAAVGSALGKNLEQIAEGLRTYEPPQSRMRLLPGIKNTLLIDDTYNSSPAAVEAALGALALIKPHGRSIAVLGDMLELGRQSVEEHRKVGAHVAKTCDLLIVVGFRARDIAQGALDNGMKDENILQFEDSRKAGAELQNILQVGDMVLIKGSQSVRMERVVEEVMAEPERASELLVRQDAEWKKR
jgi:UDP-N-acetylmuramoyl-tripeptide--D-alanyl-D-alanine ligase